MVQTTIAVVPRDRFAEGELTTSSVLRPPAAGFRLVAVDRGCVALKPAGVEQAVRSRPGVKPRRARAPLPEPLQKPAQRALSR